MKSGAGGICEVCAKEIDTVGSRVMTLLIRIGWLFMMALMENGGTNNEAGDDIDFLFTAVKSKFTVPLTNCLLA